MRKAGEPIPLTTLLRFPILFGGFIIAASIAFINRKALLGDMEDERRKLYKEDPKSRELIEALKEVHRKNMYK